MIVLVLLSCLCYMGSPVPLSAKPAPPLEAHLSPRIYAAQATEAQTQAPLAPNNVDQPQPQAQPSSQPLPSPQLLPQMQQFPWSPLGGAPLMFPFQPQVSGPQAAAHQPGMPMQPLVYPSFGYLPLFPPYSNQLLSPYRLPEAPLLPQAPANQAPPALPPASPAETALTAAPGGEVLQIQPQQQQPQVLQPQQSPQVIYMMQQPMNPQLGGLSSEELQVAAKLSQMRMFTVMNTVGGGAMQPVNQGGGVTIQGGGVTVQDNTNAGVMPAGVQKAPAPSGGAGGTPCAHSPRKAAPEPAGAADVD